MKLPALLAACVLGVLVGASAGAQERGKSEARAPEQRAQDLVDAVVLVRMKALPDARSIATLGPERAGSGVVIDGDGHVLTIGYLVIESDAIEVTTANDRTVPARLVGYDHASGFGLLKAQAPLGVKPVAFGASDALAVREPVLVLSWGGMASRATVVARREFTGPWEYLLEHAIFTSPPRPAWQGAALVNREFELVGIGSLFVQDSVPGQEPVPGNMFVPIDLLKPILADLKSHGRAERAPRPWLGMQTVEVHGQLHVSQVSAESPADRAGVRRGDIVVAVGATPVNTHADLYRTIWGLGPAGTEVPLRILQDGDARDVRVKSINRTEFFKSKPLH